MKARDLVIMDYSDGDINIYKVDPKAEVTDEFIETLGYKLSECYWMITDNLLIQHHKGILK